jgi:Raf kinase inhibitor-like YbhB/YbcL family protein
MKKFIIITLFACSSIFGENDMIKVTSTSFKEGSHLAKKYAYTGCGGENVSPQLSWTGIPDNTKSIAIIVHDPDAPSKHFIHWALYNLDPSVTSLDEGVSKDEVLDAQQGASQGLNDFGAIGYDGPCPPSGEHRYFFTVYAFNEKLALKPGAKAHDIEAAVKHHSLAQGHIVGTFKARI